MNSYAEHLSPAETSRQYLLVSLLRAPWTTVCTQQTELDRWCHQKVVDGLGRMDNAWQKMCSRSRNGKFRSSFSRNAQSGEQHIWNGHQRHRRLNIKSALHWAVGDGDMGEKFCNIISESWGLFSVILITRISVMEAGSENEEKEPD